MKKRFVNIFDKRKNKVVPYQLFKGQRLSSVIQDYANYEYKYGNKAPKSFAENFVIAGEIYTKDI